jgi:hypothetical protein
MLVAFATVSGLHDVAVRQSFCLLIPHVHHWVILLAISGGIDGWGTTRQLLGLCSLIWHGSGDRQGY